MDNQIYFGDNLKILRKLPSESIDLIYIDPPFNTKKIQKRTTIKTILDSNGDRTGFKGNTYRTIELGTKAYNDSFDSYIDGFLRPRLEEAHRLLKPHGSLYFHIDYREVHYCKILLDEIFGRENFLNEIIWAYDFGGRPTSRWPAKHDNILLYVKDINKYIFNTGEIDREDYMAPGLVGREKAKRKKLPTDTWWFTYVGITDETGWDYDRQVGLRLTDTWWHTIVGTNSKERSGYPTQKPRKILDRIIAASSLPSSTVLDFFAGSGTTGESCISLGRKFILIDNNKAALEVMANKFADVKNIKWMNFDPKPFQLPDRKFEIYKKDKPEVELNPEFVLLAAYASSSFREDEKELEKQSDLWKNSPFERALHLPAARKGKLARHLISSWCESKGITATASKGSGTPTLIINGLRIAIKMSTRWVDGKYQFQQIRSSGYDYVICLGISPFEAHCWIFKREYAIKHAIPQHKAEYWISIDPDYPPDWAQGCGGTLDQAYQVLKDLKKK